MSNLTLEHIFAPRAILLDKTFSSLLSMSTVSLIITVLLLKFGIKKVEKGLKIFFREEVTKLNFLAIALRQSECEKLKLC